MNKLNMRIANRAPKTKNGVYPFSEQNINNIPYLDIFIEDNINELITQGCKDVLYKSMSSKNKYRYGEFGLLVSTIDMDRKHNAIEHIYEFIPGVYNKIYLNNRYRKILLERHRLIDDIVFIHNHPNNSTFSGSDLIQLAKYNALKSIIAVGNRHNIFVATKIGDVSNMKNFIYDFIKNNSSTNNEDEEKFLKDKAASIILKTPDKYNIAYNRFRRYNNE